MPAVAVVDAVAQPVGQAATAVREPFEQPRLARQVPERERGEGDGGAAEEDALRPERTSRRARQHVAER
jgi:hypothetical protein